MTEWTQTFKHPIDYLLLEDGSFLLLETGDDIILDQTGKAVSLWTTSTKN